jgi:hypothetical protein
MDVFLVELHLAWRVLLEELKKKLSFGNLRGPIILPLLQFPFQVSCRDLGESSVANFIREGCCLSLDCGAGWPCLFFSSPFSFYFFFSVVFVIGLILDPSS